MLFLRLTNFTASSCPHVRVIGGNAAVISYVRLTQSFDSKFVKCPFVSPFIFTSCILTSLAIL